jgi:hypothetical protein
MRQSVNVNDALSCLRSVYLEWGGFLSNPRFGRQGLGVSWEGYKAKDFVDVVTASFVSELAENGQYSFQVTQDGSIFQLHYEYDRRGRTLIAANLSFLFSGNNYLDTARKEIIDESLVPTPDIEIGWLRIDYSNSDTDDGGVTHPKCHMHLSHFPETRLIVDRVPNPKQFVEFVISICYPMVYKEKRLDEAGNFADKAKMCNINIPLLFGLDITEVCTYAPYLHVPTVTVSPMMIAVHSQRRK